MVAWSDCGQNEERRRIALCGCCLCGVSKDDESGFVVVGDGGLSCSILVGKCSAD